ncbi:MFS transporter [Actinomadura sp. KC345]|uniref:MFS transporter n=1 Tax=Actinomadura sp. KC345 TaxID=2530371 RepID=UPI001048DA41|nr:MFS transporter [Actinomadura sp. KC345]TDC46678.1 MFS transporter [Actinomadura sp. KC345]
MSTEDSGTRNRWWLVAATGLAVFMAQLDVTIVNVALPTIEHDFGTSTSLTEWVVLGYVLPLIALSLPGGRRLDRVGPERPGGRAGARHALTRAAIAGSG